MKKAPPEAGPKASRKTVTKQYTRSLPVLQISPAAIASLSCLARFRYSFDVCMTLGYPNADGSPASRK